jgi:hypothetical protein
VRGKILSVGLLIGGLTFLANSAQAFALLGQYESWMQPSNDFRLPEDWLYGGQDNVGGPMWISNGFRWNVPVVTYGFDQSFLNFFGTNGVAAVEGAIQILNDLPPASKVELTNYPSYSSASNPEAAANSLFDLQSVTLSLLLEEMGLASPTRSIYVLRQWTPILEQEGASWVWYQDGLIPQNIVMRNFDPTTFVPSLSVNGYEYYGAVVAGFPLNVNIAAIFVEPENVPSLPPGYTAVADHYLEFGDYFTGLTADDVGGLRFLYGTNNIAYETLLPGVSGVGAYVDAWQNGALRPGVNKVTLIRHPVNSSLSGFSPLTNQYSDVFVTNGGFAQQELQRLITQPDILFSAADFGQSEPVFNESLISGTSSWINNAALNGRPSEVGLGIIQPPITITFAPMSLLSGFYGSTFQSYPVQWGTYAQSTNPPIVYPQPQSPTNQLTARFWFNRSFGLYPTGQAAVSSITARTGTVVLMQTSTNLIDWVSIGTNQVNGSVWSFTDGGETTSARFFRVVPQ